jgi:two-component system response regulator MprA
MVVELPLRASSTALMLCCAGQERQTLLLKHLQAQGYQVLREAGLPPLLPPLDPSSLPVLVLAPAADALDPLLIALPGWRRLHPLHPLLLLLPRGLEEFAWRVQALDAGVDDVLPGHFALEEMDARLRALLRRSHAVLNPAEASLLQHRDLEVHLQTRQVLRAGASIRLTVKEYELLLYLLRFADQALPRQQILHAVWGDTWTGDANLLDVYIRYLRKKIERPDLEPLIHTVRGVGYRLS